MYCKFINHKVRKEFQDAQTEQLINGFNKLLISRKATHAVPQKEFTPPLVLQLTQKSVDKEESKKSVAPERGSLSGILEDRANRINERRNRQSRMTRELGQKFTPAPVVRELTDRLPKKRQKFS